MTLKETTSTILTTTQIAPKNLRMMSTCIMRTTTIVTMACTTMPLIGAILSHTPTRSLTSTKTSHTTRTPSFSLLSLCARSLEALCFSFRAVRSMRQMAAQTHTIAPTQPFITPPQRGEHAAFEGLLPGAPLDAQPHVRGDLVQAKIERIARYLSAQKVWAFTASPQRQSLSDGVHLRYAPGITCAHRLPKK